VLRAAALIVLAAIASAGLAYVTRDRWTGRVASWAAERFAGISLEIGHLEWKSWHRIELRDVRVAPIAPSSAVREARLGALALDFDIRQLARQGLAGLHAVGADRVHALVDLSQPSGSASSSAAIEIPPAWPRGLPAIHLRGLDLEVRLADSRSVALTNAVFAFDPKADAAEVALSADRLDYRDLEQEIARPLVLDATWRAGELAIHRLEIDPRFRVRHLAIDISRIAAGEIAVDGAGQAFDGEHELRIALTPDAAAGPGFALEHEDVALRLRSRALDLSSALSAALPEPPADLDARVDLDLDLTFPADRPRDARGRVLVDALDARFAGHALDWLRAKLRIDESGLRGDEIFLLQGANQARISDLFVPRDVDDLCQLYRRLTCAFEAEIEDVPALLAEVGKPDVQLSPHKAHVRGWIVGQALELDGGQLYTTGGRVTRERGHVPLASDWRTIAADPELELKLQARFDDVAPLATILAWPPAEGRVEASVGVLGGEEGLHGWADVQAEDLRITDQVLGSVAAHGDLARGRIDVEHMLVVGPDASLDVRGGFVIGERALDGVHVRGWLRDASVLHIEAVPRGEIELDADLEGKWPVIDGRVFARAGALETESLGRVSAEITAHSRSGRIDVDALTLDTSYGNLRGRGSVGTLADLVGESRTLCLRVDELEWKQGDQGLALAEPVDVAIASHGIYVRGLDLHGASGSVEATLSIEGDRGSARANLHGFDPGPWIARFMADEVRCRRIDLDLDARWSASDVSGNVRARAEMLQMGTGGPATNVELECALKDKRATLGRLSVSAVFDPSASGPGARSLEPAPSEAGPLDPNKSTPLVISAEFPLDLRGPELLPDGPIRIDGEFEVRDVARLAATLGADSPKIGGRLRADLDLVGTWSSPHGKIAFSADDLVWSPNGGDRTFGPCSIQGTFELDRDLAIEKLVLELPAGVRIAGAGRVSGPFDFRDALHGKMEAWRDSPVDLSARVEAQNLALLTAATRSLRRLGGKLSGNVTVKGTFAHPSYGGELELTDGEVRTASALAALTGLTAKLTLDGEKVRLDELKGEMGGAPFSLSGTCSPFGPDPRVDLDLVGEHLLLYRASGLRVRAGAKLAITGPVRALEIRGDLSLDDSRFTQNFNFLSAFGKQNPSPPLFSRPLFELPPPFDRATFDVKIGSTSPFILQNNLIKGGLRPDLRLVGTGALPILRGTISIDQTRISLPSGRVTARSGTVEFLPSAPFSPRIDALADARLQGYDIKIHVGGTIAEPVVELSSVPPLPHEDLLLLVLTGTLPRADQKSPTGMQAAQSVAVYLASDVISSWFGESSSDDADLLEVTTGRDVTETGAETATARLRVWKGIFSDNSSLYVTGERDIYDRYNFGARILFRFP
jgi:hypothetical protein